MAHRIGVSRSIGMVLFAVAFACLPVCAQSDLGSLVGRLTDSRLRPLADVAVIARNQKTGAEARTSTSRDGSYAFKDLPPGAYTLEAVSPTLGRGEIEDIPVSSAHIAHVQVSLVMEANAPAAPAPVVAAIPQPGFRFPPQPHIETAIALPPELIAPQQLAELAAPPREIPNVYPTSQYLPTFAAPPKADLRIASEPTIVAALPLLASAIALLLPAVGIPAQPVRALSAARSLAPPTKLRIGSPAQRSFVAAPDLKATEGKLPLLAVSLPALPFASVVRPTTPALAVGAIGHFAGVSPLMVEVAVAAARSALRLTAIPPGSLLAAQTDDALRDPDTALSSEQLQRLPLRNRDWQSLSRGEPGADDDAADEARIGPPGSSLTANLVENNHLRSSLGAMRYGPQGQNRSYYDHPIFAESAIRAVQLLSPTRLLADSSFVGGTFLETRQGGAGFHGQLSLYSRQNALDARNPFTQWVRETAPAPYAGVPTFTAEPYTPSSHDIRAGADLGSELLRGRLGWFGSVDATHRDDPAVSMVRHPDNFFAQPTNDQMQVLAARLGLSTVDPVGEGLVAYSSELEQLASLLGPAPRTSTRITAFGRIDWRTTARQGFTFAVSNSSWNSPGGGFSRAAEMYGSHSLGSYLGSEQSLTARWRAFLTPNLMNVLEVSYGRDRHDAPPSQPSAFEQAFNINNWGQLPEMVVDSRYGFTIGNPARFGPGSYPAESNLQLSQQLDWARGRFLLKAGLQWIHGRDAVSFLRNGTGTYHYSTVENFISDALSFGAFGISGQLSPQNPHNCDETGRAWRDASGQLHGLGYLPCYSSYTQTIGPADWWLSTNDWGGNVAAQWQPARTLTAVASLRWQRQQLPPPIAELDNPDLPLTQRTPDLGNDWAPRASLAWGSGESHLPVLRLGYGMFYSRVPNLTLLSALTQTGSLQGDLRFLTRPTDNLNSGGAPPFPYVLNGPPGSSVMPGAVEFAPGFRNGEVHQAALSLEEMLPWHFHLEAGAAVSLGRRLPSTVDANYDPAVNPKTITYAVVDGNGMGPIKAPQITVPYFANWPSATGTTGRLNPNYQQVSEIFSRANSTWQAASLQVTRNSRGFTLHARYTYAHATDWNPDASPTVGYPSVFDPTNPRMEYGPSNLDVRHLASGFILWESRFRVRGMAEGLLNGWSLSGTGSYRSGLPYTMRTAGSIPKEFLLNGPAIVGLSYGMNGYGGDNRVYGVGRNTYRYQPTWKADLRLAKKFNAGGMRELEILAESFNLFNHSNVTELETIGYTIESGTPSGDPPTLTFLTGLKSGQTEFGQPLDINATNYYHPREIQFGLRMYF